MTSYLDLPLSLRAIAYLCFLYAVWIGIDAFVVFKSDLYYSGLIGTLVTVAFVLLNVLSGFGLLNLEPGWRKFLLVCCWLSFILCPIYLLLPVFGPDWIVFYEKFSSLIDLASAIWTYRVLTRPHIRRLFGHKSDVTGL